MVAISRTLVEGTWLKNAALPGGLGEEFGRAFGKPQAGVRDDQPDAIQASFFEVLEERAPARLVLLGAFADAENLPITVAVHADRHQQRDVANLASPAALEHDAVQVNIRMLAFDCPIATEAIFVCMNIVAILDGSQTLLPTSNLYCPRSPANLNPQIIEPGP